MGPEGGSGGTTNAVTFQPVGSRCVECSDVHFPPRDPCPCCWSKVEPLPLSPYVTLETYTVVHRGLSETDLPYALGVGAFPEGVRTFGRILGEDLEGLHVGQRLDILPDHEDITAYCFHVPVGDRWT
jgi:uncharacterized OB-fold protein